jgi:hypothetical protein
MAVALKGITTSELLKELSRRMACTEGDEKRTIFFGPPGRLADMTMRRVCMRAASLAWQ